MRSIQIFLSTGNDHPRSVEDYSGLYILVHLFLPSSSFWFNSALWLIQLTHAIPDYLSKYSFSFSLLFYSPSPVIEFFRLKFTCCHSPPNLSIKWLNIIHFYSKFNKIFKIIYLLAVVILPNRNVQKVRF